MTSCLMASCRNVQGLEPKAGRLGASLGNLQLSLLSGAELGAEVAGIAEFAVGPAELSQPRL